MIDLRPAATRVKQLLDGVDDAQLDAVTPLPGTSVGALIDHIGSFAGAFTAAAEKRADANRPPPPAPDAANLTADWRARIGGALDELAAAWDDERAWQGMTAAGGIELPAEVTGLVALDELVVHGWDLAVATTQAYAVPDGEVEAALGFVGSFDVPRDGSLFGPVVPVPAEAPPLDRLIGLTGRDPRWAPSSG